MAISWHLLRFALCARTVCERYWLASSPLSLQTDWIAAAFRPRCCQLIWIFLPSSPPPPISYFLFRIVSGGRSNQQPAFVYGSAMATAARRPARPLVTAQDSQQQQQFDDPAPSQSSDAQHRPRERCEKRPSLSLSLSPYSNYDAANKQTIPLLL